MDIFAKGRHISQTFALESMSEVTDQQREATNQGQFFSMMGEHQEIPTISP